MVPNLDLLVVRGPLGVGKTAASKLLAKRLRGRYVSIDQILAAHNLDKPVDGQGIPLESFLEANRYVMETIGAARGRRLAVIDGNFYYQEQLDDLVHRVQYAAVFTLTAPRTLCIRRDSARPMPHGADAAAAVYALVAAVDYGISIDTAGLSPEAVADAIIAHLRQ